MRANKERRDTRKAVSGVIAATILFAMLFTTGATYFAYLNYLTQLQELAAKSRFQTEMELRLEDFTLFGYTDSAKRLYANVTNVGPVSIAIVQLFVQSVPGSSMLSIRSSLAEAINPGTAKLVNATYTYSSGTVLIKVVSERGKAVANTFPIQTGQVQSATEATVASAIGPVLLDFGSLKFFYNDQSLSKFPLSASNQSGELVGGYFGFAIPMDTVVVWKVDFKNVDPERRDLRLNKLSMLGLVEFELNPADLDAQPFFIIASFSGGVITPHTSDKILPYGQKTTIYFGSKEPGGTNQRAVADDKAVHAVILILMGSYSDTKPLAQTVPFQATAASGRGDEKPSRITSLSATSGATGATITVNGINFETSVSVTVNWVKSDGTVIQVGSGSTSAGPTPPPGDLVSTSFTVPSGTAGWYMVYVSDGINAGFFSFQHT